MEVGPSRKKLLRQRALERDRIEYEDHRKRPKIHWFYGQYQAMFKDMKRSLGHYIYFREGLPTFQLVISDIDPKCNSIIVLDDLMDLAVDCPIIEKTVYARKTRKRKCDIVVTECFSKRKTQHQYES